MKCYVDTSKNFSIDAYKTFLEDIFEVSFKVKHRVGTFICLESNSNRFNSYLLIRGENLNSMFLLTRLTVNEKNIILISCTASTVIAFAKKLNSSLTKNKLIYYSEPEKNLMTNIYDRKDFGLEFDPTKSEYMLGRHMHNKGFYYCLNKYFYKKKVRECLM